MAQASPVARYHVIEMALAARIREGLYEASGVPGERALAEEFGAARVTIRSALKRLEEQGLVVRSERRGTLVVSGMGATRRRLLSEHVDRFLDRGRPDRRKVLAFGYVPASPAIAHQLRIAEGDRILRVLRLRSDERGPLTLTEVFVTRDVAPAVSRASLERKAFVQLMEEHGVRIGTADQTVVAAAADYRVAQTLGVLPGAPVLRLSRVLHDGAGVPLQVLHGWYRADRFEFRMRMSRAEDATRVWIEAHDGA
jgi:GntR family transcriptional regulator